MHNINKRKFNPNHIHLHTVAAVYGRETIDMILNAINRQLQTRYTSIYTI